MAGLVPPPHPIPTHPYPLHAFVRQEELTPAQYKSKDWAKRRDAWRRRLLRKADGGAGGGTDGLTQLTDALIDLEVALLFSAVLASWRGEREDWQERVL